MADEEDKKEDLDSLEDGETEGEEGEEEEEGKGGFNAKKAIIFLVIPLLLIGGGGTAAYFMGYLDSFLPHKELLCEEVEEGDEDYDACVAKAEEEGLPFLSKKDPSFFDMPNLIVNLNSTSKHPRFLKISLKLELEEEDDLEKIEAVMPRVIDHFQTYLRELRIEDLHGSAGLYRLRSELLSRVNMAAPDVKVQDVLFQELLIQ